MNGADKQAAPPSLDSPEVGEESALMEAGLLSPGEDGYGAVTPPDESIDAKEKRGKKAKKAVVDLLKIDMASERTFFKWFRTGMQIGAIGTFVFIALDKREESPLRFAVVAFAWLIGLLLVLYGVYSYYQRRGAIRRGDVEIVPDRLREHSPILVVVSLILVVSAGLAYALYTGQTPHKGHSMPRPPVQPAPQPAPAQRIPRDGALKRGGYSAVQRRWAGGHPPVAPPDIMAMAGSL